MTQQSMPETRLFAILARESSLATIFRRGPHDHVQLILWNRENDTFQPGQWFRGRIYERRCDLSPSGKYLIYFATNFNPEANRDNYYAWTAVSKTPYLSALLLWPKKSTWGGGGLFKNESEILLNHNEIEMQLGTRWQRPKSINIRQIAAWAGGGEDNPILEERLRRDGWEPVQPRNDYETVENMQIPFETPITIAKQILVTATLQYSLEWIWLGLKELNGPWWVTQFIVRDANGKCVLNLGRCDWADVDRNGDILFANSGKIFRLVKGQFDIEVAKELIDLRNSKFERVKVPSEAQSW